MGVQLPRSPVRLSLFRCSSLFVLLYGFFVSLSGSLAPLCTASLFRCPALLLPSVRLLCFVVRLSRSPLYGFFVSLSDSLALLFGSLCFVVRLSLFRCPTLFVSLSDSLAPLCTASLFRCPTPSLDWSCPLSHARVPYIYYLFSIWELNPVESLP